MGEELKRTYENSIEASRRELLESPESKRLKDIQSMEAEYYVQDKLIKVCENLNLPLVVLRGVQTFSNVGKHLTEFGIKLSKLSKLLKRKEEADFEAEHDIMALTTDENGLVVIFIQVKTNEYRKPWDENNNEQCIDKKNLSKAKDQLMRDVLRFSELLPDIKFSE